jgi:hypothetical protein
MSPKNSPKQIQKNKKGNEHAVDGDQFSIKVTGLVGSPVLSDEPSLTSHGSIPTGASGV